MTDDAAALDGAMSYPHVGRDDQKVWTPRPRFLHHSFLSSAPFLISAIAGFPRVATFLA
jgi:hypothetical protein